MRRPPARLTARSPARSPVRARALVVALGSLLVAGVVAAAGGCVGQESRNDDRVGPHSYRPDAREHT